LSLKNETDPFSHVRLGAEIDPCLEITVRYLEMAEDAQEDRKIGVKGLKENVVLLKDASGYTAFEPTHRLGDKAPGIGQTAKQTNVRGRPELPKMLGIPGIVPDWIVLSHEPRWA
jgi:hypothetical protein